MVQNYDKSLEIFMIFSKSSMQASVKIGFAAQVGIIALAHSGMICYCKAGLTTVSCNAACS